MRENRYFVVPVNTHSRLRAPCFLGPHDTLLIQVTHMINIEFIVCAWPYHTERTSSYLIAEVTQSLCFDRCIYILVDNVQKQGILIVLL